MGGLWKKTAPEMGHNIVVEGTFPVGTNEFGDMIRRAKEANADLVISQMLPPDAIALRKQMRSLGYKPKAAFFEKGGEPVEWWEANGQAAQGTMSSGFWHPALPYPGAMAKTNKTCVVGPIKYDKEHVFRMPYYMLQWQNGQCEIVYPPKLATAKLIYPLP